MNKNRVFAIFILIALLMTCIGVSFASNDFENTNADDYYIDSDYDVFIDEEFLNPDFEIDTSYLDDDYDLNDEDWDDDDYLDDEDWDDEDWEDWDDDDYLDDEDWDDEDWEDWDDYDWDDEADWFEEGNYTENGTFYYYQLSYKNGKALGCAYMASNSYDAGCDKDMMAKDDTSSQSDSRNDESNDERIEDSTPETYAPTSNYSNYNTIAKTIDFGDIKDTIAPTNADNSKNTSVKTTQNNETTSIDAANDDMGIFAVLALLLVSLVVLI